MLSISLAANVDSFIAYLANRRRLIRRYAGPALAEWLVSQDTSEKETGATIANWRRKTARIEISGTVLQIYISGIRKLFDCHNNAADKLINFSPNHVFITLSITFEAEQDANKMFPVTTVTTIKTNGSHRERVNRPNLGSLSISQPSFDFDA